MYILKSLKDYSTNLYIFEGEHLDDGQAPPTEGETPQEAPTKPVTEGVEPKSELKNKKKGKPTVRMINFYNMQVNYIRLHII